MRTIAIVVLSIAVFAAAQERNAYVTIRKNDPSDRMLGVLHLNQLTPDSPVRITGKIRGLEGGLYESYVHEKGDLTEQCHSTGNAYIPWDDINDEPLYSNDGVGHVGQIAFNREKKSDVNITNHWMSIGPPFVTNSIIGRSIVLHSSNNSSLEESVNEGDHATSVACGVVISREDAITREAFTTTSRYPATIGRYPMTIGRYPMTIGREPMTIGREPMTIGREPMTIGWDPATIRRDYTTIGRVSTNTNGRTSGINTNSKSTFVCCNNGGSKNLTINIKLGRP